jgi:hypothetical protein
MNDEKRIVWVVAMAAAILTKVSAQTAADMADTAASRYEKQFEMGRRRREAGSDERLMRLLVGSVRDPRRS